MNRLIYEKSPYLLQHSGNPVDWYPWGKEAFERAKREDKPLFISIGYSTCHWCHVMGRESFADDEVARALNASFICIKVDREELPDVDAVYMNACVTMTGSGGWPLTIIATPDGKPFFTATYLPKRSERGMMGLIELINGVAKLWSCERGELEKAGERIQSHISSDFSAAADAEPTYDVIQRAFTGLQSSFDPIFGGFGRGMKFPMPCTLLFLLGLHGTKQGGNALRMVETTLICMYRGGIYDHLGGGFSRYSVDRRWFTPHFEKMLYDNALLAWVYAEAYRLTGRTLFRRVAEQTLDYMERELMLDNGGFCCGQDADSEDGEGGYYVFTADEIRKVLGESAYPDFAARFGVTSSGNYHDGKNILNLIGCKDYGEATDAIGEGCARLLEYRSRRRLHRDEKQLASWNALAIIAFSVCGRVFQNPHYTDIAMRASEFIFRNLSDESGGLLHSFCGGEAKAQGLTEDYALLALAQTELYSAGSSEQYIASAIQLMRYADEHLSDTVNGGFFDCVESALLCSRPKTTADNAVPSGNSAAALALMRLCEITSDVELRNKAAKQLNFMSGAALTDPASHCFGLLALEALFLPCATLTVLLSDSADEALSSLLERKDERLSVTVITDRNRDALAKQLPFIKGLSREPERTTYYLCRNGACLAPEYDISKIEEELLAMGLLSEAEI